jgi:hypothetical protein
LPSNIPVYSKATKIAEEIILIREMLLLFAEMPNLFQSIPMSTSLNQLNGLV